MSDIEFKDILSKLLDEYYKASIIFDDIKREKLLNEINFIYFNKKKELNETVETVCNSNE